MISKLLDDATGGAGSLVGKTFVSVLTGHGFEPQRGAFAVMQKIQFPGHHLPGKSGLSVVTVH